MPVQSLPFIKLVFVLFLVKLSKLRKMWLLVAPCLSVCLSVRRSIRNSAPIGRIFIEFHIWLFFETVKKIPIPLNLTIVRVLNTKTYVHLWRYLAGLFLEWEIFQTKVTEELKPHASYSKSSPLPQKSFRLRDNADKPCCPKLGHKWQQHKACSLNTGEPRLQTHTENM